MDKKVALHFRDEFRKARDSALKDAEGYQQILFVLERMGSYLLKKNGDLGKYEYCISKLVEQNCPSFLKPSNDYHIKFDRLYEMVRNGRNDALHQGAVARMMTSHSVQLSMMIEDTLMAVAMPEKISEYMVKNPVCAHEWQPISFIRQIMLENSFSHIPFYWEEQKKWHVISDLDVAKIRQKEKLDEKDRAKRLMGTLKCWIKSQKITPPKAKVVSPDKPVCEVLKCTDDCTDDKGWPVLVKRCNCKEKRCDCRELLGIVTPYDLM